MIKLFAQFFEAEYLLPEFRFFMHSDCTEETIAFFCLISKDLFTNEKGKDFFSFGYILKYIKEIGLKCEICVGKKHVENLKHFLNEHYIFNSIYLKPEEFIIFKF